MVHQCPTCATPNKQQMIPSELPEYPWQKVATDLFHLSGKNYIAVVVRDIPKSGNSLVQQLQAEESERDIRGIPWLATSTSLPSRTT